MKLKGIFGKGSGKLGSSVFAISGGEQIVREYNPVVTNPSTTKQVEQRSKFKLLTQLAAVFAGCTAFKKSGLKSARNQFVSANYPAVTYEDSIAKIAMSMLKLSDGLQHLKSIEEIEGENQQNFLKVTAYENNVPDACLFVKVDLQEDNNVNISFKQIVTNVTDGNTFISDALPTNVGNYVYAVGLYLDENAKRSLYASIIGDNNDASVKLEATEKLLASAYRTTATLANEL